MARKVSEYRVFSVEDESGAIRVNLVLTPQPAEAAELRRLTLNALRDLQTAVGKDLRLSAWAHTEDTSAVRGMAFYSALSETYHFKDADELP